VPAISRSCGYLDREYGSVNGVPLVFAVGPCNALLKCRIAGRKPQKNNDWEDKT